MDFGKETFDIEIANLHQIVHSMKELNEAVMKTSEMQKEEIYVAWFCVDCTRRNPPRDRGRKSSVTRVIPP